MSACVEASLTTLLRYQNVFAGFFPSQLPPRMGKDRRLAEGGKHWSARSSFVFDSSCVFVWKRSDDAEPKPLVAALGEESDCRLAPCIPIVESAKHLHGCVRELVRYPHPLLIVLSGFFSTGRSREWSIESSMT